MAKSTKPRVVLELNEETGLVSISGPLDHPTIVLKMLASGISQVATLVQPIQDGEKPAKPEPSRIITLGGGARRA